MDHPDLKIRWGDRSSISLDKGGGGGGGLQNFFLFGLKIRGAWAPSLDPPLLMMI